MEPISWVNQYPAGIMIMDSEGNIKVPPSNAHQTVVQTAQKRVLDLINTGSTHKLKPLNLETFANLRAPAKENLLTLIILFLALGFFWRGSYPRLWIGLLLIGASVLLEKLSVILI